jgi:hypothetical protein
VVLGRDRYRVRRDKIAGRIVVKAAIVFLYSSDPLANLPECECAARSYTALPVSKRK